MVWDEARLVSERMNREEATQAVLLRMAIGSVLDKDASREFQKIVQQLSED